MTDPHADHSPLTQSVLKRLLRTATSEGIDLAKDPANAGLPDLALRVTTIYSRWYARTCPTCKDRFREGDQVRLCPMCPAAFHDDSQYDLHCWQKRFLVEGRCAVGAANGAASGDGCTYTWDGRFPREPSRRGDEGRPPRDAPSALLVGQFLKGLETVWRPYGEQPTTRVTSVSGLVGRKCPLCRFRVRAGDWVVACPCGCGAYFHQDIFRHLTCWNEWNGVEGNDHCPNTGRRYPEPTDART